MSTSTQAVRVLPPRPLTQHSAHVEVEGWTAGPTLPSHPMPSRSAGRGTTLVQRPACACSMAVLGFHMRCMLSVVLLLLLHAWPGELRPHLAQYRVLVSWESDLPRQVTDSLQESRLDSPAEASSAAAWKLGTSPSRPYVHIAPQRQQDQKISPLRCPDQADGIPLTRTHLHSPPPPSPRSLAGAGDRGKIVGGRK
jgi:hypothetical protein